MAKDYIDSILEYQDFQLGQKIAIACNEDVKYKFDDSRLDGIEVFIDNRIESSMYIIGKHDDLKKEYGKA